MKLSRRIVLASLLLASNAQAADQTADAAAFVRQAGAELGAVVAGSQSVADKQARLTVYLHKVVDEDGLAQFCLGRYWAIATPEQRDTYGKLFRQMLLRGVVNRLGDYQTGQVSIVINTVVPKPDGLEVPTVVQRSGNSPVRITWLVVTGPDGTMRIADVVAEGMSLRQTQRSDFAAFLSHNGGDVSTLITAMQHRVSEE